MYNTDIWCGWVKQITLDIMHPKTCMKIQALDVSLFIPCRNGSVYTPFIVCFTHSDAYINGIYLPECHISQRLNFP